MPSGSAKDRLENLGLTCWNYWRPRPELNWCKRFCRPLRNHSATWPQSRKYLRNQSSVSTLPVLCDPRQTHETRPKTAQVPTKVPTVKAAICGAAKPLYWCAGRVNAALPSPLDWLDDRGPCSASA